MNTQCRPLGCLFACLWLALSPSLAARASDTPAVAVVRQFLLARSSGHYGDAYVLLSPETRKAVLPDKFAAGTALPPDEVHKLPGPMLGMAALFADTHNTLGYTFTVIGPDPADPNAVLVRADPPASAKDRSAVTLRLLTVLDPAAHAPRLDLLGTMERTAPQVFARARDNAKRAESQSHLKLLSLGIIQYLQDHDERAPDAMRWVGEIMPYVKDKSLFHDPSAPDSQTWSYAYNRTLSGQSLAAFEAPAQTVMLFESSRNVKNASDTGQSVPRPGRHLGGSDHAFADGHVKWLSDGAKPSFRLDGK